MWGLLDCTHYYHRSGQTAPVLRGATLAMEEHERTAIFAPPGHGKSTVVRLLTGVEVPHEGEVLPAPGVWPLGYAGAFRPEMSGDSNVRAIARMAGVEPGELAAFALAFSELGEAFFLPMSGYTNRMKARLGFAISFGIPTNVFIADDKLVGGEPAFREKCEFELDQRLATSGLVFLTSNPRPAEDVCERFVVLEAGQFVDYPDYDQAREALMRLLEEQEYVPMDLNEEEELLTQERDDPFFFDLA